MLACKLNWAIFIHLFDILLMIAGIKSSNIVDQPIMSISVTRLRIRTTKAVYCGYNVTPRAECGIYYETM